MRWSIAALLLCACSGDDPTVYSRYDWHPRWYDTDKDCQDTRQEVLIAEGTDVKLDAKGCRVVSGTWNCLYTGAVFTDPSKLDIDHFVPLKNAHDSGGWSWTQEKRRTYSNDLELPDHLVAVSASANRSKGARGPDKWLPTNEAYRCDYVRTWLGVKAQWELTLTAAEAKAIADLRCEVKP
jgi:hypothetical protein